MPFKPDGYTAVSPSLIVSGAGRTIDVLTRVFNAAEIRHYQDEATWQNDIKGLHEPFVRRSRESAMNNKSVLEQANAAVTKGDYEGFLLFCTDDTLWTFVGDRVLRGKEAVRRWMTEVYTSPPELTVDHLISEGEFLTAVGTVTMDEGGKKERYAYCDVWRLRDGKLAELRAFVVKDA